MVEITIDSADTTVRRADDRGRVRLGPEYAGETVEVAVVEVKDEEKTA